MTLARINTERWQRISQEKCDMSFKTDAVWKEVDEKAGCCHRP